MTNAYCIHDIYTPDINYESHHYFSDGYHDHLVNGQIIDGHPHEIQHYEEVIDEHFRSINFYDDDDFWKDLIITIDEDDQVTVEVVE